MAARHPDIIFDGPTFRCYGGKGPYFVVINGPHRKKMFHRLVWELANGPIRKGMVIHHIDHNPLNNDISNLTCITQSEHNTHHPDDGLAKTWAKRFSRKCDSCGRSFTRGNNGRRGRFCSGKCSSKWRRDHKIDHVYRTCVICGSPILVAKHLPSSTCYPKCTSILIEEIRRRRAEAAARNDYPPGGGYP